MNNEIKIFSNSQFGDIRTTLNENNNPIFCARDVAMALGYSDTADAISRHCKSGIKVFHPHPNGIGGVNVVYIPEKDVYRLIMRSNMPDAEKFQDWVCDEVLPSIRKNGGYLISKEDDTPELIMARAVIVAQATIEKQKKQIEEQKNKIVEDAPKVLFYDSVTSSNTVCLMKELATILNQNGCKNIGQNRLFAWLRKNGYLGTRGEYYNMPTQKAMDLQLFKVTKGTRVDQRDGSVITTRTTKVTTKGLAYFIDKFLGNQ